MTYFNFIRNQHRTKFANSILEEWLTPKEAMHFLQLGQTSIYALMKSKEIERIKFGGKTFISVKSCEELIKRLQAFNGEVSK
tara:strand:+ start:652 stop:897 length:246 start_codon:yes stop_codon:yes gene_type:complete